MRPPWYVCPCVRSAQSVLDHSLIYLTQIAPPTLSMCACTAGRGGAGGGSGSSSSSSSSSNNSSSGGGGGGGGGGGDRNAYGD